jgi:hypothetical protein
MDLDTDKIDGAVLARLCLAVEPVELPGGLCPHVCRPEAPADVLERMGG